MRKGRLTLFGTWLGMIRITWGNPQSGWVEIRAWLRATIGVLPTYATGETRGMKRVRVWLNATFYSTRSAIIGLAVETIWARRTLHSALLLSPAEDLVLKVLSLHHPVLKWDLFTNLLSLYGRRVRRTGTAGRTGTPWRKHAKMSAP